MGVDEERVTGTVSVERLGADEHAIRLGRAPTGQITATTVDEGLDRSRCLEALSGTTAIAHNTRRDLITYDGAIDCDEAMSARWTADGVDQGLLAGIQCAVTPRRAPSSIAAWVAVLVVLRRMRRRSARLREVVRGGDARRM